MTNNKGIQVQRHPYHLVDPSPHPLVTSLGAFLLTSGATMYMHNYVGGGYLLFFGLTVVLASAGTWWRDVTREATFQGHHTIPVQTGLRWGMILFIVSEIMFFFGFFFAFFWSSLGPNIEIGGIFPPPGIETLNAFDVPLLNTIILLTSGATMYMHNYVGGGYLLFSHSSCYAT